MQTLSGTTWKLIEASAFVPAVIALLSSRSKCEELGVRKSGPQRPT